MLHVHMYIYCTFLTVHMECCMTFDPHKESRGESLANFITRVTSRVERTVLKVKRTH